MQSYNFESIKKMVEETFEMRNGHLVKKETGEYKPVIIDYMDGFYSKGLKSIFQPLYTPYQHKTIPFGLMLAKEKMRDGHNILYISLEM
jgi:hypothetical protein